MNSVDYATLERAVAIRDREIALRVQARRLELTPDTREAARALFAQANGLRKVRMALLDRCGLR